MRYHYIRDLISLFLFRYFCNERTSMKKLLIVLFACFAILSFVACSDKGTESKPDIEIEDDAGDTPSLPE